MAAQGIDIDSYLKFTSGVKLSDAIRNFIEDVMAGWISYAEAAVLAERYTANADVSAQAALCVLAAGLRWKAQFDSVADNPALSAEAYALAFPMHKAVFRELATLMRDATRSVGHQESGLPSAWLTTNE
jgi:hypothetical protein